MNWEPGELHAALHRPPPFLGHPEPEAVGGGRRVESWKSQVLSVWDARHHEIRGVGCGLVVGGMQMWKAAQARQGVHWGRYTPKNLRPANCCLVCQAWMVYSSTSWAAGPNIFPAAFSWLPLSSLTVTAKNMASLSQNGHHSSKLSRHRARHRRRWLSSHTALPQWSRDGQWTCDGGVSHATSMCACIVSPSEEVVCDLTLGLRGPSNTFADPHLGT